MKVLGIDSSTLVGGACVMTGDELLGEYVLNVAMTHSERLMPAIERVFADCGITGKELDGIAVSQGPGSFTGLRIGITTAKALAYCWNVPLVGVGTLDALAHQVGDWHGGLICPIMNARRNEVYAGIYRRISRGEVEKLHGPLALPLDEFLDLVEVEAGASGGDAGANAGANVKAVFLGDGVKMNWETIGSRLLSKAERASGPNRILRPSSVAALGMARLESGRRVDPMQLTPIYVRKSEAEVKWEKRHGLS